MISGGKTAVMTAFGGPEVFEVQQLPIPEPAVDEVRVRIAAVGVAYADVKMRHGLYKTAPNPPMTTGYDFSGVIDAVGRDVKGFKVGDQCIGLSFYGASAEYLTIKTDHIALAPDGLDHIAGAAIPLNYITAYQMLERLAVVSKGDTILLHGAAGGVSTAILDLVKNSGLNVYGTASAGKHDLVRAYGATPIDYRTESFADVMKSVGGADAVFDHIAGKHIAESSAAAKRDGRVIVYGFMSGVMGEKFFMLRSFYELLRMKFFSHQEPHFYAILTKGFDQMEHIPEDLKYLAQEVANNNLKPNVGKVLTLDDIAEAHRLLEAGEVTGKIVLTVNKDLVDVK